MTKEEAIKIIVSTAAVYDEEFKGYNYLYVYDCGGEWHYIEASYPQKAFMHLTGVQSDLSPAQFYQRCLDHRLSPKDFDFRIDGTTVLKMNILPRVFNIRGTYRMLGIYNNNKPMLYTERIMGGQYCCMGFVHRNQQYCVPNTTLSEDIRDMVDKAYRIVAVCKKPQHISEYNDCIYRAKGISEDAVAEFIKKI